MDEKRREEFLQTQQGFRENAYKLIKTMDDWSNRPGGDRRLVDEMLHCIFFLGRINSVPFPPEEIFPDKETFNVLKGKYPRPFGFYLTQLPRRSPFSCVLDMVVLLNGPQKEEQIKQSLQQLFGELNPNFLVSSTICISQKSKDDNTSARYYGVSMSTKMLPSSPNPGRIVVGASCLSKWDQYVADAVMTYYPKKVKKDYFDATMILPERVRCAAFELNTGKPKPPCRSCGNLFGLQTTDTVEWPYGHCAENESVSNLLKNEQQVKTDTQVHSHTHDTEQRVKEEVRMTLVNTLKTIQFNTWTGEFYSAQSA